MMDVQLHEYITEAHIVKWLQWWILGCVNFISIRNDILQALSDTCIWIILFKLGFCALSCKQTLLFKIFRWVDFEALSSWGEGMGFWVVSGPVLWLFCLHYPPSSFYSSTFRTGVGETYSSLKLGLPNGKTFDEQNLRIKLEKAEVRIAVAFGGERGWLWLGRKHEGGFCSSGDVHVFDRDAVYTSVFNLWKFIRRCASDVSTILCMCYIWITSKQFSSTSRYVCMTSTNWCG